MEDRVMFTNDLATISRLLDLDGFEVIAVTIDKARKVMDLSVAPVIHADVCPHCSRVSTQRHTDRNRDVVDLPLGGFSTRLSVAVWQFRCDSCDKFFTPGYPGLDESAHATERFLARLAEVANVSDVSSAARLLGVAAKTAEGWYYDYLRRQTARPPATPPKPVRSLGIDELSLKKDTASSSAC